MQEVLMSLLQLVLLLFNPVILTLAIIIIIVLIKKNKEYKNGAYYQITQHPYFLVKHNTGIWSSVKISDSKFLNNS